MSVEPETQSVANLTCMEALEDTLQKLRDAKPDERNELARRYAVTITEMEKVTAYFYAFVVNQGLLD